MTTITDRLGGARSSLAYKAPVKCATTENITLSGAQTIDGVAVVAGDRVLVKDQTAGAENGIYEVAASTWARAADMNSSRDVTEGTRVDVIGGTVGVGVYQLATSGTIVLGTTSLTFSLIDSIGFGNVLSRTALKALNTNIHTTVYLTEAGREGLFLFQSGDYSAAVTADTAEGVYIAATDTASSSGAWVRVVPPSGVTPGMFGGAKGDSTTSSITAIEAAYAHENRVYFDGLYYVGDGGVDLDAAGTVYADAPGCGVAAIDSLTETTGNGLINITASGVNVLGLLVDGRDDFRRGVRDTAGGARVEGCTIENIYSTTASTVGIFANATAGGSIYRGNIIREIESVGNAPTSGDDNGASRAIQIFTTAAITQPYVIHDNDISRIIGEEGDGVQILCFSSPTFYSSGKSVISENRIRQCSKRAVKVQAHETTVRDNNIVMLTDLGADLFAGIDIINSEDAIVDSNRVHVTSTVRGISVTGTGTETSKRPVVSNNRVKTDTGTLERAISVNEFEDCSIINNYVEYGYIVITNGTKGLVANNVGNDLLASGTNGFILAGTDSNQITFDGNTVLSGSIYAAVHIQSADNVVTNNRRMDGDTRCVYLSTANATDNTIIGNMSSATTLAPVIFSTVTRDDQETVEGNYSKATNQVRRIVDDIGFAWLEDANGRRRIDNSAFSTNVQAVRAYQNSTNESDFGGVAGADRGTATAQAIAATNYFTRTPRQNNVSTAATTADCGMSFNVYCWLADATRIRIVFGWEAFQSNCSAAVGVVNSSFGALGDNDASARINWFGLGLDTGDTNWSIMQNDGTGAATEVALGASYPANTSATDLYELILWWGASATTVNYQVCRLNSPANTTRGTLTGDLPSTSTTMQLAALANTRTGSSALGLSWSSVYVETL